nr:hypothetical protein [Tanacetum cinerariifolium]
VAIGYKNPLCLTRAKQAQPALYNGHEIIKENHIQAIVHNSEDTLEIAEIIRKKMNDKMNDPESRFTDMHVANTTAETRCLALEAELANLQETKNQDNQTELINYFSKLELQVTRRDTDRTRRVQTTESKITKLTGQVTHLQAQNDLFRAENDKVKQHYKQLYDSIKITHAKHIEQVTKLTAENLTLRTTVSKAKVQPSGLTQTKHA